MNDKQAKILRKICIDLSGKVNRKAYKTAKKVFKRNAEFRQHVFTVRADFMETRRNAA